MAVESEEDDAVVRMINSATALHSETLDLGAKLIYETPNEILNLKHLESLHLESNYITELPEGFFEKLINLKWLDLRNNRLTSLPIAVGKHRAIRSLLLEGNSLTHLPCELGMSRTLCGLSLSGNPLEFPPPHIVQKGTQEILKYLREMCENSVWTNDEKYPQSDQSDEDSEDLTSSRKKRLLKPLYTSHDFPEPTNTPSTFHPPPKRIDQLRYEYDKLRISSSQTDESIPSLPLPRRRASVGEVLDKTSKKTRGQRKALDGYSPASATTLKEAKASRERRLRRSASLNQKEAVQQQRIKNKLAVDDWRQKTRSLQQQKQYQALRKGTTKVKIPSPFATAETENAEGSNGTQKKVQEYNKRLQSLLKMNDKELTKKVLKDRELEERIKNHIKKIREQRNPAHTASEEVEETKNNLELAHKLHVQLGEKRAMEYRLRAFTGDDFVLNPRYYKNNK